MRHYDYIFTGAGLSALMTVYRMAISGKFRDKSMLLIDASAKTGNDRTWCFWEKQNGEFDRIVSKKWDAALFAGTGFDRLLDLSPYRYKMIRGIDFYRLVLERIGSEENICILKSTIVDFAEAGAHAVVKTGAGSFTCNKIFNSVYRPQWVASQKKYPLLQQHFIGWRVKTAKPVFNPKLPTFMDFSIDQKGNTRFMYVLPFSADEALVEYTLFSKDLLPDPEYQNAIAAYLEKLGASGYEILETERGNIPMTSYKFWENNTANILHIGSAGGWTKASTGYTFKNAMKQSARLVDFLQHGNDLRKFHRRNRFWFYDLLLLDILSERNGRGGEIFSSLFRYGNPALILKFLDEETSLAEDLQVILKCPKSLFIGALYKRLFK